MQTPNTETDRGACGVCDTGIPKDTPISNRKYYIQDSGQLCSKCYTKLHVHKSEDETTVSLDEINELTERKVIAADDTLKIGQRRNLTVVFHYPESSGNDTQNLDLTFTMCAEATQTKNNPGRLFESGTTLKE